MTCTHCEAPTADGIYLCDDGEGSLFALLGQIPDTLADAGAVRRNQPVKVLGTGELGGIKVDVSAHAFSSAAAEKIGAAGGSTTVL